MALRIHWYPGHMSKARRIIKENIRLVDLVIELRDARIPRSSANPEFELLSRNKERMILLNKKDLADPAKTQEWIDYFKTQGVRGQALNCLNASDIRELKKTIIQTAGQKQKAVKERKGIRKAIRIMVVGIPNVGKSTLINRLAGGAKARTEDRPGVTRGKQWVKIHPFIDLLDTPGLLWPKSDDQNAMLNLAFIGSIRDEIIDLVELANTFLDTIMDRYPGPVAARYKLENIEGMKGYQLLEVICKNQGWIRTGGIPDLERGAKQLLNDFRSGRLGGITLETP